jgi:putative CocE/NonD family hydrolase
MLVRKLTTPLLAAAALALPASAAAAPTHYVKMSDGIEIAINVQVPPKCTAEAKCPTFFEMSGYESGSDEGKTPLGHLADDTALPFPLQTGTRAAHAARVADRYVTVLASVRGSGCSSGEFDLFSWRSALDGKEVIDEWIARQPWSNGKVAIFGHSYSGITGTMIAATRPEHLTVLVTSGLIGDLYRDIVYPGGITNYGFPLLWTGGIRVVYDVGGGTVGGLYPVEQGSSEKCAANQAQRSRNVLEDPLVHGLDDTDGEWFHARSLTTYADKIDVPTHITSAYQDEQTGPRGPTNVFDHLNDRISKRLVLTNGVHGTNTDSDTWADRIAWMDYWMLGKTKANLSFKSGETNLVEAFGPKSRATETSRVILDRLSGGQGRAVGEVISDGFPLGQTRYTDLYATEGGKLIADRDAVKPFSAQWANGSRRQAYSYQAGVNQGGEVSSPGGPDEVSLVHRFAEDTAIAGPITTTLQVAATAPDTELFVQLIDQGPDGSLLYLQRGMLRASHRAIQPGESDWHKGRMYRPYRAHQAREVITPGQTEEYLVEVFPVGHVFKKGHRLLVKVHAPPADDNDYNYVPKTIPALNTLSSTSAKPTSITLPVIPMDEVEGYTPAADGCVYASMRCVKGAAPTDAKKKKRKQRKRNRRR